MTTLHLLNKYIRAYRLLKELQINNIKPDDIVPIMEKTLHLLTAEAEEVLMEIDCQLENRT